MLKKVSFVVALAGLLALPLYAQRAPAGIARNDVLQRCGSGNNIVFTNLVGQNHRKYNNGTGYFVDGSNFFNQVLGQAFTPSSSVTFADVIMPMGVYTLSGGQNNPGILNVYLESDSGGVPGSVIEGPLSRCQGISNFSNGLGGNFVEFDCISCTTTLSAGTQYWIVAMEAQSTNELTWDEVRGLTDASSPFAFNQSGCAIDCGSTWLLVGTGFSRASYEVDSF